MGKPTGFMEYDRCEARSVEPKERIKNFDEFHIFLSKEKQREQAARCMDCGVPFCQSGMTVAGMTSGCPLHNLVPEWNDLLYTGNYQQAYNRLHKTNNFPEFTSRVCPALCEKACTCGHWGDPVSVRDNEHGIIETAYKEGYAGPHIPKVRTGKKVAIIGSGPSGLAAADQLNQRGHDVTVYERDDRVGGLLMYGIPNMKLEKQIIDRKIEIMKEEGIEFNLLTNPIEIVGFENPENPRDERNGFVTGVKCVKMQLGEPDDRGRRRPEPIDGSEFVIDADTVIIAIGTSPNPLIKNTTDGLEVNKRGGIVVDENGITSRDGVFAGGDAVTGAATVISAMGAGKLAAHSIDKYLS